MKKIISKGEFKLLKAMIFVFLTIGFDLLSKGILKSIVFAILFALVIMEIYNGK